MFDEITVLVDTLFLRGGILPRIPWIGHLISLPRWIIFFKLQLDSSVARHRFSIAFHFSCVLGWPTAYRGAMLKQLFGRLESCWYFHSDSPPVACLYILKQQTIWEMWESRGQQQHCGVFIYLGSSARRQCQLWRIAVSRRLVFRFQKGRD